MDNLRNSSNGLTTSYLDIVLDALQSAGNRQRKECYAVPNLWHKGTTGSSTVDPAEYYGTIISSILSLPHESAVQSRTPAAEWTSEAVIYNHFVRLGAAFDHDRDGRIGSAPVPGGFRETGTLLKSIAMLPYIQRLGANTVYLLPLTSIGQANRKGLLGSPYAIRNPYLLDPLLGEPALNLPVETQLQAFVEAAHRMNMRVVFEFVFRTASIDSDWVSSHPGWFYWIRKTSGAEKAEQPYGPPRFEKSTLAEIYEKVDKHDFSRLPAPDAAYRNRFVQPPEHLRMIDGSYEGLTKTGEACRVASAFSDWPPDDLQPPWTDVAYLKMHRDTDFNYIAYNTIRMYDEKLDRPGTENSDLWEEISGIIPWYQQHFDIDGAMIDMGHALPRALKAEIVEKARAGRPHFAFWDENFDPSPRLLEEGFNAVFGSLPFVVHEPQYIKGLLNFLNKTGVALPFFATAENHNTPRVCHHYPNLEAGRNRALFLFTLGAVLPALPFLHAGMELCEWHPVNLGLNFSEDDRKRFPPDTLPLFNPAGYDWENSNGLEPIIEPIRKILKIRQRYIDLITCGARGSIIQPYISDPALIAVMRKANGKTLIFAGNSNVSEHVSGFMEFDPSSLILEDLISTAPLNVEQHRLSLDFGPGQCYLFELPEETGDPGTTSRL
jgi:glycosidase